VKLALSDVCFNVCNFVVCGADFLQSTVYIIMSVKWPCVYTMCTPMCTGGRGVHIFASVLLAVPVADIRPTYSIRVNTTSANARSILDACECVDGCWSINHIDTLLHWPSIHHRPPGRRLHIHTSALLWHCNLHLRGTILTNTSTCRLCAASLFI